jgi:hypothetical protein
MAESLSSASPGGCIKVFLRRNDGNGAARGYVEHLLKIYRFYCYFPLMGTKIGLPKEQASGQMVFSCWHSRVRTFLDGIPILFSTNQQKSQAKRFDEG